MTSNNNLYKFTDDDNLLYKLTELINTDVANPVSISYVLLKQYKKDKDIVDNIFITLCGHSLTTILSRYYGIDHD